MFVKNYSGSDWLIILYRTLNISIVSRVLWTLAGGFMSAPIREIRTRAPDMISRLYKYSTFISNQFRPGGNVATPIPASKNQDYEAMISIIKILLLIMILERYNMYKQAFQQTQWSSVMTNLPVWQFTWSKHRIITQSLYSQSKYYSELLLCQN